MAVLRDPRVAWAEGTPTKVIAVWPSVAPGAGGMTGAVVPGNRLRRRTVHETFENKNHKKREILEYTQLPLALNRSNHCYVPREEISGEAMMADTKKSVNVAQPLPVGQANELQAVLLQVLESPTVSKEFCAQLDALKQISTKDLRTRLN